MKITQVEPQKKNPHRFNIFLDGEFAFGADEDLVVSRRLVVGKEIKNEDLKKILFEAEIGKLMERMYRLFNIRQRSEKEILDYLKELSFKRKIKGYEELSPFIIDAVAEVMKKKGLINDEEFARAWVESRSRKYGINRIKQELFQKGIERETIEEVLSIKYNVLQEEETAEQALNKKLNLWKNLEVHEFKKKAYDYLLRKGFEYSLVKLTIEKLLSKE